MCEERIAELEGLSSVYSFLSSVFLTLPDQAFMDSLAALPQEQNASAGYNAIAEYAREVAGRDREEALLDLGRDRARLVRGANNEGIEPPYESLYLGKGAKSNTVCGSINRFFADAGFEKSDDVKDAPEQIGIEINFVATLVQHELVALRKGDAEGAEHWRDMRGHFMSQHLGRWAHEYAKVLQERANTAFYRGIGLLIEEVV